MAGKSLKDVYGQVAALSCVESVAGTAVYTQFDSSINSNERLMMLIHKVEYFIDPANLQLILDSTDRIRFGLSMWSLGAGVAPLYNSSGVLDFNTIGVINYGAASNGQPLLLEHQKDFTSNPGGGLISHPSNLFLFVVGISLASVVGVYARVHYTTLPLKDSDYAELYNMQILKTIIGV